MAIELIATHFNQLPIAMSFFLDSISTLGSLVIGIASLFPLLVILLCRLAWTYLFSRPASTKLRLRGLPTNAEPDQSIESTMDALMAKGFGDPGAPRLISRLEWRNQMNRFMEMLPSENEEVLERVVNHIQVLLSHHQMDQPEVQKDLVRVICDKAVGDPANSHLYARLCQKLAESQIDWTLDFIGRLFQLVVDEFNRPLVLDVLEDIDQLRSNKTNVVKLMAAIFKRKIPRVPDEWITDCANCLIQRQAANLDNSTQQLCLFLKTILISESDHDCNNLLPSQQNLLLPCIEALQRAILNRKLTNEDTSSSESSDSSSESETDSESETESEPDIKTA